MRRAMVGPDDRPRLANAQAGSSLRPHAPPRPALAGTLNLAVGMARSDPRSLPPQAVPCLQGAIGNAAVSRLLHQVAGPPPPVPVVQRVADPDGDILNVLQGAYASFHGSHRTFTLPTPSALRKKMVATIASAVSRDAAFEVFAAHVGTLLSGTTREFQAARARKFVAEMKDVAEATAKERKARAEQLEKLRDEEHAPPKRRRVGEKEPDVPVYSDEEKARVRAVLAEPQMATKLFHASSLGYDRHRAQGREAVEAAARLNALGAAGHMRTADLARAQASYTHSRTGDALLLEQLGTSRVTMGRTGGQEIHQLGPYLGPGSVQELIKKILATEKVNSRQLGAAISMSSADSTERFLKEKGVPDKYLVKVRSMRHLLAVEMDRGPEVAVGTALEHRSGMHGYRDITDCPRFTPLGPPQATTELRKARKRSVRETQQGGPADFAFMPAETRKRGLASITHFVTSYVDAPTADPEAARFVSAVLNEPDTSSAPREELIAAAADVMRTPEYNPWEESSEEESSEEESSEEESSEEESSEEEETKGFRRKGK